MSVTFWVPGAPTHTVTEACYVCDGAGKDASGDCHYCNGTGYGAHEESTLPEINMANGNARALLLLLGVPVHDLCGTWSVFELPTIKTKLMLMQMGTGVMLESETVREQNMICMGRDSEYVQRRITDMLALVDAAIAAGLAVSWG